MTAFWAQRVIGRGLKSSGLQSLSSRVFTHARLLGHPADGATLSELARLLPDFRKAFPCGIKPAAPPLGSIHGLDVAIDYATVRAPSSLFFRSMSALLQLEKALYCRPTALLEGNLRRNHLSFLPATATYRGGLVANLLLPKRRKGWSDARIDSHAVPMGPAVVALLSLMDSLGLLQPGADREAVIFPEVDPKSETIVGALLSNRRATELLRRYVFTPAGIPLSDQLTLRSIRSGASTDAHIGGVPTPGRLAQGGWETEKGASTYLDLALAALTSPSSPRPPARPAAPLRS